jgi:hypothetical protein
MPVLTLASELAGGGNAWAIVDDGHTVATLARDRLRVSLSWKAIVFDSDADRRRHDEHTEDIDLAEVLRRFRRDLAARGVAVDLPADPVSDPGFVALLQEHYVRYPAAAAG